MHEHLDPQQTHAAGHRPLVAGRAPDQRQQLGNAAVSRLLSAAKVQRAGSTSGQQLDESVARAIDERRGRGKPLDDGVRTDMEASLGHDLSDVRVHTDGVAHELNQAIGARAFTTGNDVFFKQGTYDAGSSSGRELLGHELTHVVQQRTGTSGLSPGEISHPSDAAEQHAADVGRTVEKETAPLASVVPRGSAGIARQDDPEEEEGIAGSWEAAAQRDVGEEELEPDESRRTLGG